MARFFNPESLGEDAKLHAPACERNRDVILDVLETHFPTEGTVLEIAAGTGQHSVHFAPAFPNLHWQPSDIDERHLMSIAAWRAGAGTANLLAPVHLDVTADWDLPDLPAPVSAMTAINLIHIAPWEVAMALFHGAANLMESGGILYLYGPYKQGGAHTADSNAAFDAKLRGHNPSWGVRDMESVIALGTQGGFTLTEVTPMPANNFSLVFKK